SSPRSRRPPRPTPRTLGTMRRLAEEQEPAPRSRSSSSMKLPPPPPPRRDSRPIPPLVDEEPPTPNVTVPADIDLDEESLSGHPPRLNVPPLKPVVPVAAAKEPQPEPEAEPEREPPTANRGRAALAKGRPSS